MNLSAIRYSGLRHKYNDQIQAKFCPVYGKIVLCPRIMNTWAVRFRNERISVEDHIFGLFRSISLAKGVFPSKDFRKWNDSILPSLL
jgi:hypothetical protein